MPATVSVATAVGMSLGFTIPLQLRHRRDILPV
jgi:hypothetical protein